MTAAQQLHHVLLVEDTPADVFLIESCIDMNETPIELSVAQDGVYALDYLERGLADGHLPEVVLLDLNMPRMNGFEVLEALRNRKEYAQLPVIVLTTSSSPIDRERAQQLGARAFVTKPQGLTEVADLLSQVVSELRGQARWTSLS